MTQSSIPSQPARSNAGSLTRESSPRRISAYPILDMGPEFYNKRLLRAIDDGDLEGVRTALSRGADPIAKDEQGRNAYERAQKSGHLKVAQAIRSNLDRIFLDAIRNGDRARALEALDAGADIDAQDADEFHETALMLAVTREEPDMCRFLLGLGADKTKRDDLDMDAHDWAIHQGNLDIIALLE